MVNINKKEDAGMYDWKKQKNRQTKNQKKPLKGHNGRGLHVTVKDPKLMILAVIVLVVCCVWGGYKAYMYHTQARYQIPGHIYAVKVNKNSKLAKQALGADTDTPKAQQAKAQAESDKPTYFVFGKNNHAVAMTEKKSQAQSWVKDDHKIKKNANDISYKVGKNSVDFKVTSDVPGKGSVSMPFVSGDDLKFHQNGNKVDGNWSMSLFGISFKLPKDTMTVYNVK